MEQNLFVLAEELLETLEVQKAKMGREDLQKFVKFCLEQGFAALLFSTTCEVEKPLCADKEDIKSAILSVLRTADPLSYTILSNVTTRSIDELLKAYMLLLFEAPSSRREALYASLLHFTNSFLLQSDGGVECQDLTQRSELVCTGGCPPDTFSLALVTELVNTALRKRGIRGILIVSCKNVDRYNISLLDGFLSTPRGVKVIIVGEGE